MRKKNELIFKFGMSDIRKVLVDNGHEDIIDDPKKMARIREVCRKHLEWENLEESLSSLITDEAEAFIQEGRLDHDAHYKLDESIRSVENMENGALETFGHDYERVKRIFADTPKKLWTVRDGDGGLEVVSGFHYVNRLHYLVTLEDCKDEDEDKIFNY